MTEERSADEALAALGQLVIAHADNQQAADAMCTCVKVKSDD